MIFRSEEDFDRTLDEFAKARRAWPLYLARSVRLRSPVIGNLAGRRSKESPAEQRRRRGSRPSSTALRRRWIEFGCCSSAGLFSSWWWIWTQADLSRRSTEANNLHRFL